MVSTAENRDLLNEMITNRGEKLLRLTNSQPVLLVFLRHFGCTFCREALADIAKKRQDIEQGGVRLVFVHMSDQETAERYFNRYELEGVDHIADPACKFYQAFGLTKGTFTQLFGLQTWIRGFNAGVIDGHGIGQQLGDGFQMPGIFVISNGVVKEKYIHRLASDRPDYFALAKCCTVA